MSDHKFEELEKSFISTELLTAVIDIVLFLVQAFALLLFGFLESIYSMFVKKKNFVNVKGKTALITGSGSGLGKEIAFKLAEVGCNMAVVDIDESCANFAAEEIRRKGFKAKSYKVDISKKDEIKNLMDNVLKDLGPVDILVCNAGLIPDQAEDEIDDEFLQRMVNVNVTGTILVNLNLKFYFKFMDKKISTFRLSKHF